MTSSSYDYTKAIVEQLKILSEDKQKEVLDFVEFLVLKENNRSTQQQRVPNLHKDKIRMRDNFNEPLSDSFWL